MMWVMDSGLGGISVVRALRQLAPRMPLVYLADTAGFPYGNRPSETLAARAEYLLQMLGKWVGRGPVILACNTLSTLCLDTLRVRMPEQAFVGTVPAIKTAARDSQSKRFTLLATPNTAHSRYTDALIASFAEGCHVDRAGAPNLARYAEAMLLGEPVAQAALRQEIAPAFCDDADGRTDAIVLGCTHYPLILDALQAVAPWPVRWIDSSHAIARRALEVQQGTPAPEGPSIAYITQAAALDDYRPVFLREGFDEVRVLDD